MARLPIMPPTIPNSIVFEAVGFWIFSNDYVLKASFYSYSQNEYKCRRVAKKILTSVFLFFVAGLCEIGGGYLVWLWLREDFSWMLGAVGGFVLFLYGIVPTFQNSH